MPVSSSTFSVEPVVQKDGRQWVTETHTLTAGEPFVIQYLAEPGTDYAAAMSARVPSLNIALAELEAERLLNNAY